MKALIFTFLLLPLSLFAQLNGTLSTDVSICEGSSGASITFTGSNGTAPYTFTYNINGGSQQIITTTVGNSVSVTVPSSVVGLFTYYLTQVEDYFGAPASVSDQANATVNSLPPVNAGVDQMVCPGTSVTLSGSSAVTYTWNNGVTNGVAFVPLATNTYTVTGTSIYGCINTDQVTVFVECANIDEKEIFNVNIFPNPANFILNIESESVIDVLSVYSSNGQLAKQLSPNSQKLIVDLSDLTQGVYLFEMSSEKGKIVKRIIVQ